MQPRSCWKAEDSNVSLQHPAAWSSSPQMSPYPRFRISFLLWLHKQEITELKLLPRTYIPCWAINDQILPWDFDYIYTNFFVNQSDFLETIHSSSVLSHYTVFCLVPPSALPHLNCTYCESLSCLSGFINGISDLRFAVNNHKIRSNKIQGKERVQLTLS